MYLYLFYVISEGCRSKHTCLYETCSHSTLPIDMKTIWQASFLSLEQANQGNNSGETKEVVKSSHILGRPILTSESNFRGGAPCFFRSWLCTFKPSSIQSPSLMGLGTFTRWGSCDPVSGTKVVTCKEGLFLSGSMPMNGTCQGGQIIGFGKECSSDLG